MMRLFRSVSVALSLAVVLPCAAASETSSRGDQVLLINSGPNGRGTNSDSPDVNKKFAAMPVLSSIWKTEIAFSNPYLPNRYKLVYFLEAEDDGQRAR